MNIYDIWFARLEIANSIKLKLLKKFASEEIWNLSKKDFIELTLRETTINKLLEIRYRRELDQYESYMEKNQIALLNYKDELYPQKLKYISNKPAYIFCKRKYRFAF